MTSEMIKGRFTVNVKAPDGTVALKYTYGMASENKASTTRTTSYPRSRNMD